LRILVVSRRYPPDQFSGTETVISHVYEKARDEFPVRLVAGWVRDPALLPSDACKVPLGGIPKPVAWMRLARAARREIRRFRPDVVLANSIETPAGLVPTVAIVYDFNFGSSRRLITSRLRERFYRRQSRQFATTVVISEATRQAAIAQGFAAGSMAVIHPGVDVDRIAPGPAPPAEPGEDGQVVLAYPSRIIPGKGQHLAIDAFERLPRRWRDRAELRIVGAAPDPEYLESLRRRAVGLDVTFHLDVPEIVPFYQSAHVVLFPTMMEEGFGYTAVEGLACGRPVVHFSCAAVDEACGGHAVGVPAGDADAMAKATAELLDDPRRCEVMGASGRDHVVKAYAWDVIWRKYRSVLAAACGLVLALTVPLASRADTVLLDEALGDGSCDFNGCTVSEGAFDAGGWRVISADSNLHFDLSPLVPDGIPCGEVSLEFFDFDPVNSGHTGEYINFLGLYEDSHGNNWDAAGADEAQLQFQGTCDQCVGVADYWRDWRVKFKAGACDWDIEECGEQNTYLPGHNNYDIDWAATRDVHYTATAAWSCSELAYSLTDGSHDWSGGGDWGWHPKHATGRGHFRHLFVGRDHSPGATRYIDGAVYAHVQVVEHDDCDCAGTGDDDDTTAGDDDDTTAGDDDTTAGDDDTTAGDDDSAPGDDDWTDNTDDGGCGCSSTPARSGLAGILTLLAAMLVRRARA
jgi:glycosyltransferase involved in cell wall biosynthesis